MEPLQREQLSYESYLCIPQLLSLQNTLSADHDELLFIQIHQVYELWFKQILHELTEVKRCFEQVRVKRAIKVLHRVETIQKVLVAQIDVLETMTPVEFATFRDNLRPASGFQSIQFRELEFFCGLKNPHFLTYFTHLPQAQARLQHRINKPTLYDAFLRMLHQQGFTVGPAVLERDITQPYEADETVLTCIQQIYNNLDTHYDLYMLCEALLNLDENMGLWRYRHVKMVERTIGMKVGTGGSSGAHYLTKTLAARFFPELWDVRTLIGNY